MDNQKLQDVIKERYGKIARGEQTFCCPTSGPTTTDQCLAVGYNAEDLEMTKMANDDVVLVKILELPGVSGGCSCGSMPCTPEVAAMFQQKVEELRAALEEAYPGKTGISHVNLKENQEERESEIGQLLVTKKYPGPLVVINGEPKFAGSIQVKKIVKEVGAILG